VDLLRREAVTYKATYKVTFEMDSIDFENLMSIIQDKVVKHKYEAPCNLEYSDAVIRWHKSHGEYIEKKILNKILAGATHV
jgi:hypothetical protein